MSLNPNRPGNPDLTGLGRPDINICAGSPNTVTPQFRVNNGDVANVTFEGTPPYRLSGTPYRDGRFLCQVHVQRLESNSFIWNIETTTNHTALNLTSGDMTVNPSRNSDTPVFQLGDGVQWTAHELAEQPDGQVRYFQSGNYTITLPGGGTEEPPAESGGLRIARSGVMGWLVVGLFLSGAATASL